MLNLVGSFNLPFDLNENANAFEHDPFLRESSGWLSADFHAIINRNGRKFIFFLLHFMPDRDIILRKTHLRLFRAPAGAVCCGPHAMRMQGGFN